ncbi:MAG: Mu-like prophage major head subunit gpT family protein [Desulfovibrionaceae bacterium]
MALVTDALLQSLRTGFRTEFEKAKAKAPSDWAKVATLVPSTAASNTYGWLGQFPKLREWVGDRTIKDIAEHGYAVTNKLYESTVGIKRTDIEDDALGVYSPLFQEMGYAAATHPDEIIFSLLAAGRTTACYDGKKFFATDHSVYANTDGTGSVKSASNLLAPTADPKAAWYLLDVSRPLKPLIFQERTKAEITAITDTKNDHVFTKDQYLYGIRYRCNGGFGFWQQAVCSTKILDAVSFEEALLTLQSFKANGGRPLGLGRGGKAGLMLVVPQSLYSAALDVVGVQLNSTGGTNKWYDAATILNSPWVE